MSDEVSSPEPSRRRRVLKKKRPSSAQSRDRWILSYADFITLLFAFFVALYSISIQHKGDNKKIAETLNGVFEAVQKSIKPISVGKPIIGQSTEQAAVDAKMIPTTPSNTEKKDSNTSPLPMTIYDVLNTTISNQFQGLSESGKIAVSQSKHWVNLEFQSSLLFGEGEYQLTNEAVAVLMAISRVLKAYPSPVLVVGNTDDLPVKSSRLMSNWHLSSLRAASVVDELVYQGVNPKLIAPIGFASEDPKVSNTSEENRQKNRRVTLRISKSNSDNLYDYLFK